MINIKWNQEKAESLRSHRGVSFADLASRIEEGDLLDDLEHPDQRRYPGQRIFIVAFQGYAYTVPYVRSESGIFLKTLWPSRKATRDYRDYLKPTEGDL